MYKLRTYINIQFWLLVKFLAQNYIYNYYKTIRSFWTGSVHLSIFIVTRIQNSLSYKRLMDTSMISIPTSLKFSQLNVSFINKYHKGWYLWQLKIKHVLQ